MSLFTPQSIDLLTIWGTSGATREFYVGGQASALLRFDFTTGAGIVSKEVPPGMTETPHFFGAPYGVTTLGAYSVDEPCPDELSHLASYLIIAQ